MSQLESLHYLHPCKIDVASVPLSQTLSSKILDIPLLNSLYHCYEDEYFLIVEHSRLTRHIQENLPGFLG
jgi:hypothetical protein